MPRLFRLPGLFLLRSLVRELAGIRAQLARQSDLLERLATRIAPQPPTAARETVAAETGLSHVDLGEQAIVLAYIERTERETGHTPTDDEVLEYLADEKTIDLHRRLIERDREAERLAEERRR